METQMTMPDAMFCLFAGLTLLCGLMVVANPFSRNPVTSAMFLVLTILSLAGLFVLLQAFFLAAVQILVYAGAVMVLFLFIIMSQEQPAMERRRNRWLGVVASVALVAVLGTLLVRTLAGMSVDPGGLPPVAGTTGALGTILFGRFLLPFEIMSVLLLVAMIGVVVLSQKTRKSGTGDNPPGPAARL
jgi:NADH-quinone oxidoreductase subunit J